MGGTLKESKPHRSFGYHGTAWDNPWDITKTVFILAPAASFLGCCPHAEAAASNCHPLPPSAACLRDSAC